MTSSRWLTVAEACKILGVSRPTIHDLISKGKLTASKAGSDTRPWLIEPKSLEKIRMERVDELRTEINRISESVVEYLEAG